MTTLEKQPSKELQKMIDDWSESYVKSQDLPAKILLQAGSEGLSVSAVRTLVEIALKNRGLSDRTIRKILPDELKEGSKIRPASQTEPKSGSLRPKVPQNKEAQAERPNETEEYDYHPPDWNPKTVDTVIDEQEKRMEVMAAKYDKPEPPINAKIESQTFTERLALFNISASRDIVFRELTQPKQKGWKVVEITARRIT